MVRIRRFGIIRTANMVAALYALISIVIFGLIFVPLALIGVSAMPGNMGTQFGAGAVGVLIFGLIIVALYAIMGWIVTAIGCAIYNLVAGWVGGIEVQLESTTPMGGYPGYGAPAGYGAPTGYGGQYGAPPTSYGTPGSVPPPPGTPG